MRALCEDTRRLTAPLPSFFPTADPSIWPGTVLLTGPANRPRGWRAGDVAHDVPAVIAQGGGAETSGSARYSSGRTYRSPGADREARSLHGRNRAFLVRTGK